MAHRSTSPEASNNTNSTVPSYQSFEAIPRMSEAFGGEESRRSSTSIMNDDDHDIEMGGSHNQDEGSFNNGNDSYRRIDNNQANDDDENGNEAPTREVPTLIFNTPLSEDEDGDKTEEEDRFSTGSPTIHSSFNSSDTPESPKYQWKLYAPDTKNVGQFLRWTMVGGSKYAAEQTDEELLESLAGLARCLHLMREYLHHYGMPERGGPRDQELVLREVIRDLYGGGAPLWALEPVMQKAAEGLTGQPNVNWQLNPRKAFICLPSIGTTSMFKMDRGFNISKMSSMEGVAVRLASFASNVQGVSNIPARFPNPHEFQRAARTESVRNFTTVESKSKMARKILNLASKQQGLFYYVNSREYLGDKPMDDLDISGTPRRTLKPHGLEDFWVVTDEERELFSRLACQEALRAIDAIDAKASDPDRKALYTPALTMLSRVMASAGACAFWFGGSWQDMIVAGVLAVIVASIGTSSLLSKQERVVYEVVASFVVGLTAGLIALAWPEQMCFSAMAISGLLDLLQGFRVVYAIIEIMSKHTVAGGADFLEGILFTGLIAYFIQFGSYVAASIMGDAEATEFTKCTNGVDPYSYIVLVPLAALSWSFLFTPNPRDLPGMAFHGVLAYSVNFALTRAGSSSELNYFVSASAVSLSAGIFSRFTGRQAIANSVAGMYALLPGAYLVSSVYSGALDSNFFTDIIKTAVIIGIGGWTGTILCSPTLLGTTRGLLWQRQSSPADSHLRHGVHSEGRRRPGLERSQSSRHLINSSKGPNPHKRRPSGALMNNKGGRHRRQASKASSTNTGASPRNGHHRGESNVSYFDFEHPTSTMLYF